MSKPDHSKRMYLAFGAQVAAKGGQRWTEMRASVCACIFDQPKPVTAYQLIDLLSSQQEKTIKPASVYRSLDALCKLGLVVKIESLNAFIACSHPGVCHQHVFLICRQCGFANELIDHKVGKQLQADAAHQGFRIERQVLELQGACRACQG